MYCEVLLSLRRYLKGFQRNILKPKGLSITPYVHKERIQFTELNILSKTNHLSISKVVRCTCRSSMSLIEN